VLEIALDGDAGLPERVLRLGRYWQRLIAGSPAVLEEVRRLAPGMAERVEIIPCGVRLHAPPSGRDAADGLRLACPVEAPLDAVLARRLHASLAMLAARGMGVTATLLLQPSARGLAHAVFSRELASGFLAFADLPSGDAGDAWRGYHALFAAPGSGLSAGCLLSAMEAGLAILASATDRTADLLVADGENGRLLAPGAAALRDAVGELVDRPGMLERLCLAARDTIRARGFDIDTVCDRYAQTLEAMLFDLRAGTFIRPPAVHAHPELGGLSLPPSLLFHPDALEPARRLM
jgi:hypothetical protein